MKDQQFGQFTTIQSVQQHFQKLRTQSRRELLSQLHKKSNMQPKNNTQGVQSQLAQAFIVLLQHYQFNQSNPIIQKIAAVFDLKLFQLKCKNLQENNKARKIQFVREKILDAVEKVFKIQKVPKFQRQYENVELNRKKTSNIPLRRQFHQQRNFEWVGVQSNFPQLQSIFQEILLEKVRLFDNQLTQITKLYDPHMKKQNSFSQKGMGTTRAKTLSHLGTTHRSQFSKTISTKRHDIQNKLIKKGFCDVLIRDRSQFSLKKWTKNQQSQFQTKRKQFRDIFGKCNKLPIIFQFVKKYTTTVKARDNIYKKWQQREKYGISPQQLKYLCSTSLFLNKTLAPSQQARIRRNIDSLGPKLLSRLQFNIAQKIIETYRLFIKKVTDLRAHYYEQLTSQRKKQYNTNKKSQKRKQKEIQNKKNFLKNKDMFIKICNGEKMKLKLNFKIVRWVKLFIDNLKNKVATKKGKKSPKKIQRQQAFSVFSRLASSRIVKSNILLNLKQKYPTSKILKRQNHTTYINLSRDMPVTDRFYYQPQMENKIKQFNSLLVENTPNYKSQISGGPSSQYSKVYVDLRKKQVRCTSKKCILAIIAIQAMWKGQFARKKFKKRLEEHKIQMQKDFQMKFDRLWRIYPLGRKIDYKSLKARLKRISMRTLSLFKPYIRTAKKVINNYTSFCSANLNLAELKIKNSKNSARRLTQFAHFVQKNQIIKLKQYGFVVTGKQINSYICSEGANSMWWAIKNSNVQLTKKFLEGGGDPNSTDKNNNTCMHIALKNGQIEICFELIDYGADLNLKNNEKLTALSFATPKMLKLLGVEQGNLGGNIQDMKDNNSLYFNPQTNNNIYPQHYY